MASYSSPVLLKTQEQSDRAESIAKAVDGVKSVKNDLKVQ
ncbi:Osmotically inducible protein OsmY [Salmonella enterica subsp. arizonae]|uniref:Osmotically inducible protein OsmY n=1 Tax=Salmonella enterica subsp. arizonae TaxID=59203 RepID=A0A379TQU3_SALER|nr:Osmotically inducible protein OsmY [Salmonella enterica subsp. arizonae]